MVSFAGYPLLVEDRLVGVLVLFARAPFGEEELAVLADAAQLLGQGIERRRAEAALREQAARLAAVVKVQEEVAAAGLDPAAVMRLVAERAMALIEVEGAAIAQAEEGEAVFRVGVGASSAIEGARYPLGTDPTGLCLASGEAQRTDDATADPRVPPSMQVALGAHSLLAVPLCHAGETVGALVLGSSRPAAFGDPEVLLLRLMAEAVGSALVHAETFAGVQEVSRLKTLFLSTVSHELRTPLTAIVGFSELLRLEGALGPEQDADVAQIAKSAGQLQRLVDDVLDLSRIEAGGLDLIPEPVDLGALAEGVRMELAPLAEAKGVALGTESDPRLTIHADPLRLRQALLNLASNTVKFTEQGSVTIAARTTEGGVELAVRDTGIGIAPGALPHVFDEFRQADGTTSRKYGGSGLGLAITKRLVELHGGTIRAESELGVGSTFTVTLPSP
jgi:signal transduction histidine kinase